jgi:hypothetical protein
VLGIDPLAMETLWEAMYRSNRHARTGLFMMAPGSGTRRLKDGFRQEPGLFAVERLARLFQCSAGESLSGPSWASVPPIAQAPARSLWKGSRPPGPLHSPPILGRSYRCRKIRFDSSLLTFVSSTASSFGRRSQSA